MGPQNRQHSRCLADSITLCSNIGWLIPSTTLIVTTWAAMLLWSIMSMVMCVSPLPADVGRPAGFGLPNRRRRVFLVASMHGDARDVLLAQVSSCKAMHI